jgi:ABC-type antimicrobial peptide transport system permease subunit
MLMTSGAFALNGLTKNSTRLILKLWTTTEGETMTRPAIAAAIFQFPLIVSAELPLSGVSLSATLLAGVMPARNVARLDPIAALRSE